MTGRYLEGADATQFIDAFVRASESYLEALAMLSVVAGCDDASQRRYSLGSTIDVLIDLGRAMAEMADAASGAQVRESFDRAIDQAFTELRTDT